MVKILITIMAFLLMGPLCTATYKGQVAVKGNEPHTRLVLITDRHGELRITGRLEQTIRKQYQGSLIVVRGILRRSTTPGTEYEINVCEVITPPH